MEREIAAILSRAFGVLCKRNVLSGMNNSKDDGSPRPGDVVIPQGFDLLIEAKLRAKFQHHTLFKEAVADAKKHGIRDAILFTRSKGQRGYLATMDSELLERILSVPQVHAVLARMPSDTNIHIV